MQVPTRIRTLAAAWATAIFVGACGGSDPGGPAASTATLSGVVKSATGAVIQGATVRVGTATATTGADGRFQLENLPVGSANIVITAQGFDEWPENVNLVAGANTRDFTLNPVVVDTGEWGTRAPLLENNSEFALAEANGKLYVMGGYPPSRVTTRSVQIYDIASNSWTMGPQLPQPNNHGMAASVNGKIYLIGGQLTADQEGYVNTVYELTPGANAWVTKAPMPTMRSSGVAVALGGKIYVAAGRVPQGSDFAVYDPATNTWETLPDLPTQRNHVSGVAINGRVHVVGGRLGNGLSPLKTTAHEVYNPQTRTWTNAAPMLSGRSGINGVMARGCYHVWGGEAPTGMTPQHEYYNPKTDTWSSLRNMPIPIHGVVGSAYVNDLIWVTGGGTQIGGSFGSLLNQTYKPAVSCE
jgi:N-acetylneuraminic acid mutarotase